MRAFSMPMSCSSYGTKLIIGYSGVGSGGFIIVRHRLES